MLMQGLSLPALMTCASSPLSRHSDTQPPQPIMDQFELDDAMGEAVIRSFICTQRQPPPPAPMDPVDEFNAVVKMRMWGLPLKQSVSPAPASGGRAGGSRIRW
jgi:hypothetical protein